MGEIPSKTDIQEFLEAFEDELGGRTSWDGMDGAYRVYDWLLALSKEEGEFNLSQHFALHGEAASYVSPTSRFCGSSASMRYQIIIKDQEKGIEIPLGYDHVEWRQDAQLIPVYDPAPNAWGKVQSFRAIRSYLTLQAHRVEPEPEEEVNDAKRLDDWSQGHE